jgi:hypothetical protein
MNNLSDVVLTIGAALILIFSLEGAPVWAELIIGTIIMIVIIVKLGKSDNDNKSKNADA